MTKEGVFWVFDLYDKVSSKIGKISDSVKGLGATVDKTLLYFEELGSSAVRFNALADVVGRLRNSMNNAIAPGVTFEQSIADLSAITGIAGKDLTELGKAARKVGVSSGMGATQAAEAFKLLASNIDISMIGGVEGLKKLQKETITLAQASGVDLPTAADTMAASINQFKMGAEDAGRVINVLAAGAKYGAAEVPHLAESLKYVGPVAGSAGVSIESTVGALEVLSQSAIKGSQAGTDLSAIMVKMQSTLGINIGKVGLPAALQQLKPMLNDVTFLTKTFGLENLKSIQTLIAGADQVEKMTDRVTDTNVAMEQAAIRTDTYAERMNRLNAWFDNLKISIFNVTGSFMPMLQIGATALQQFSLMIPALKMLRDGYNLLTLASTRQLIADKARLVFTKIQTAWNYVLAASIRVVNLVTKMNPIILIASLVAGAIVLIIKYWDDLKMYFVALVKFWAKYLNPFGWIFQLINVIFPNAGKAIRDFFGNVGKWIFGWIYKIIGWIKKAVGWISNLFTSDTKEVKVQGEMVAPDDVMLQGGTPAALPNLTAGNLAGETFDNITSGGKKQTNISIVVEKMVETFNVKPGSGETWNDIENKLQDMLLRVVNSANRMQTA